MLKEYYENNKEWRKIRVGFVKGTRFSSKLIKFGTASIFSHVFIDFQDEKFNIFEARFGRGVINHNNFTRYCSKGSTFEILEMYVPSNYYDKYFNKLKSLSNLELKKTNIIKGFLNRKSKYDKLNILGFVLQKYKNKKDEYICSELFQILVEIIFPKLKGKLGRFSPEDAYNQCLVLGEYGVQDKFILEKPAKIK